MTMFALASLHCAISAALPWLRHLLLQQNLTLSPRASTAFLAAPIADFKLSRIIWRFLIGDLFPRSTGLFIGYPFGCQPGFLEVKFLEPLLLLIVCP